MNDSFYIYASMTDRSNRTECVSQHDVMQKFKEVVRVYRQRGNEVAEGGDGKWVVTEPSGKTEVIWMEDSQGRIVKAIGV